MIQIFTSYITHNFSETMNERNFQFGDEVRVINGDLYGHLGRFISQETNPNGDVFAWIRIWRSPQLFRDVRIEIHHLYIVQTAQDVIDLGSILPFPQPPSTLAEPFVLSHCNNLLNQQNNSSNVSNQRNDNIQVAVVSTLPQNMLHHMVSALCDTLEIMDLTPTSPTFLNLLNEVWEQ